MFLIDDYDKRVMLPSSKMNYPGQIVGYKPGTTVRKYVELPLNPFNAWQCATIKAYGVMMGTDKIGHFTDMGMHYFRGYRKALKDGANEDQARAKAIWIGTDDFVFAESGLLGWSTGGRVLQRGSHGQLHGHDVLSQSDRAGVAQGRGSSGDVERDGAYWKITSRVRPDSDFFSLFFPEHLDEALNPSVYLRRCATASAARSASIRRTSFSVIPTPTAIATASSGSATSSRAEHVLRRGIRPQGRWDRSAERRERSASASPRSARAADRAG
jgi:hypothetical protein